MNTIVMRYRGIFLFIFFFLLGNIVYAEGLQPCDAKFAFEQDGGSSTSAIIFFNQSEGDYDQLSWDFGDGEFSSDTSPQFTHFYSDNGFYTVRLTIWNSADCYSEIAQEIFVGDSSMMCDYTDCVYPGDANSDGKADFYDLLNIGMGQGEVGYARPGATTEWIGQPAPDWDQETIDGVNYKHLDSDGNGVIDDDDINAVYGNYSTMSDPNWVAPEDDGPMIYLVPEKDTVYLEDYEPGSDISFSMALHLGKESAPFEDLHGIAFYTKYPTDLFAEQSLSINYESSSFFGTFLDEAMLGWKERPEDEQVDMALTRVDHVNASGFGKVADISFIIVSDILASRGTEEVPVEFPIEGVTAVDKYGNEILVSVPENPITVIFIKAEITGTNDPEISDQVTAYPNPTTGRLHIETGDLTPSQIRVFNTIGKLVYRAEMNSSSASYDFGDLPKGIYTVSISTDRGVVNKKVIIK